MTLQYVSIGVILSLLIISGVYFLKGFHAKSSIFMPLVHTFESVNSYTLFSLKHYIDFFNQQFLISSVGICLLVVLLYFSWRRIDWDDPKIIFLGLASIYSLLFNFAVFPELGMARDWDLFAVSGIGYTVLAIFIVTKIVSDKKVLEKIGRILAVTAVVSGIPWFFLNSNEDKSLERFSNLLILD
jgi:hypothetical protein